MDGGSGGAPAHPPPPVYSAFGLVVGDLVAGGLPPTRKGIILITLSKNKKIKKTENGKMKELWIIINDY